MSRRHSNYLHWQRNKLTQEEKDARFFGRSTSVQTNPSSKGLYRYAIGDKYALPNDKGRAGYFCQMMGR